MPALTSNVFLLDEGESYGGHGVWYGPDYPDNEVTEAVAARIVAEAPYAVAVTGAPDLRFRSDDGVSGIVESGPVGAPILFAVVSLAQPGAWNNPYVDLSLPAGVVEVNVNLTSPPLLLTAPLTGYNGFGVNVSGSADADATLVVNVLLVDADGATYGEFGAEIALAAGAPFTDADLVTASGYVILSESGSNADFDVSSPDGAPAVSLVHVPSVGPWTALLTAVAFPA